jgi:hypothetical protein
MPRFCPVCRRGDTVVDEGGVTRAVYPVTCQAMLPLVTASKTYLPDEYSVCSDCHAEQYKKFYEIEAVKNPAPAHAIEDIYALLPAVDAGVPAGLSDGDPGSSAGPDQP